MKIVHFSTQETGGGSIAAIRIHRSLLGLGHESAMQFLKRGARADGKQSRVEKARALLRPALDRALLDVVAHKRNALFSAAWLPNAALRETGADVINLHWVGDGYLDIGALRGVRRPIVWTLHDMWTITGGCFYDGGCGRFASGCGRCPILQSNGENDLSARVFRRKEKAWKDVDLTIVAPSEWMAREARRSPLLQRRRIEVIQYCLDPSVFKPMDKALARGILNLPCDRPLVLFGAVNPREVPRKGYQHLVAAMPHLKSIWAGPEKPEFVLFGDGERERREESGWVWHSLGRLRDEVSLALAYAAADVFVAPSVQDNLPCTVMEAMACGTPCVAFAIGGMPDLISHQKTGFLAAPFDARELAAGIAWVLSADREALGRNAREVVLEKWVPAVIGAQYARLYAEVTGKN